MASNFQELLKKAEAEKRTKSGLDQISEDGDFPEALAPLTPSEESENPVELTPQPTVKSRHAKPKKHHSKAVGCLRGMIMFTLILALCGVIAYTIVACVLDFTALNKSDKKLDIEIPKGASTEQIATILEENDLIDQTWFFRLYSRFTHRDGKYQTGTYSLSANMGYQKLTDTIIAGKPRQTVTVTIPEGFTIDQIAKRLEENKVCTIVDFYDALLNGTYNYDFFNSIPQASDGGVYEGRIYRLEGYLFPDTYNFYVDSSGETVVNMFLANLDSKITPEMKSAMQARELTLDEVIIMASILEKEAANEQEMPKVARVLYNRLESTAYPRLECDSTELYVKDLMPNTAGVETINMAYDTYARSGLTAGAICNPGLAAIQAAVFPSNDAFIAECYFFANDTAGNTYYNKTFEQHKADCRKHGIGIYG